MIPFKLRLWRAKRKGYTPAMAAHYAVIAEYDWYDVKFLTEAVALFPLIFFLTATFAVLAQATPKDIRDILESERENDQAPLTARKQ